MIAFTPQTSLWYVPNTSQLGKIVLLRLKNSTAVDATTAILAVDHTYLGKVRLKRLRNEIVSSVGG